MRCPDTQRSAVLLSRDEHFCMEVAGLETRNQGKCSTGTSLESGTDWAHCCRFPDLPSGFSVPHHAAGVTHQGGGSCVGVAWRGQLCLKAGCQEEDAVPVPTIPHSKGLCVCCSLQPPLPSLLSPGCVPVPPGRPQPTTSNLQVGSQPKTAEYQG